MEYSIEHRDEISLVHVKGRLDSTTHDDLMSAMIKLFDENRTRIVVDLSKTEYISSAGWSVFISKLKESRDKNGDIILCGMTDHVREVFELLELDRILVYCVSQQEAVSRLVSIQ